MAEWGCAAVVCGALRFRLRIRWATTWGTIEQEGEGWNCIIEIAAGHMRVHSLCAPIDHLSGCGLAI